MLPGAQAERRWSILGSREGMSGEASDGLAYASASIDDTKEASQRNYKHLRGLTMPRDPALGV